MAWIFPYFEFGKKSYDWGVAVSERQGRVKRQEIRNWRKYQAKPGDMLRRHSFNQSRKL